LNLMGRPTGGFTTKSGLRGKNFIGARDRS
jgi:hypothetical protein